MLASSPMRGALYLIAASLFLAFPGPAADLPEDGRWRLVVDMVSDSGAATRFWILRKYDGSVDGRLCALQDGRCVEPVVLPQARALSAVAMRFEGLTIGLVPPDEIVLHGTAFRLEVESRMGRTAWEMTSTNLGSPGAGRSPLLAWLGEARAAFGPAPSR